MSRDFSSRHYLLPTRPDALPHGRGTKGHVA